jgi:acyl-CoA reductase-like NAD-dependent aldehyde dehydrogenase
MDDMLLSLEKRHRSWRELPVERRVNCVHRLRALVSREADRIAHAISGERGRALTESLSQEVLPVLEMARHSEKHMPRWLAPRRVSCWTPGFWQKKTRVYCEPLGTVLVLAPRNFPFSLGMMSLIYLALAGNTVLLKPAEESTRVGPLLSELLRRSGLEEAGAAAVLPGDAEIGERLAAHPVIQKVFFFGGRGSGAAVSALCARHAKPCVLEMGGGSTAFVARDADLEMAASGLAWSAFYAHGQSCVATERICVEQSVAETFNELLTRSVEAFAEQLREAGIKAEYVTSDVERFRTLFCDAAAKGAVVRTGGEAAEATGSTPGAWPPTVLTNASFDMKVFREEIFGPLVAVCATPRLENAVEESNRMGLDLGASVWSKNGRWAEELAHSLRSRMVWINDSSFGLPGLPWGGSGGTGHGSLFSRFALHEAVQYRWISAHPGWSTHPRFWWNPYTPAKEKILLGVARFRY